MRGARRGASMLAFVAGIAAGTAGGRGAPECPCIQASSLRQVRESACRPESAGVACSGNGTAAVSLPGWSGAMFFLTPS